MNPLDSLNWRYATKEFDPEKKISDADWAIIEESLVLTPSSFGLQPWSFILVKDEAIKAKLKEHSWGQSQVTDCSHFLVLTARTEVNEDIVDQWLTRLSDVQGKSLEDLAGYKTVLMQFIQNMSPDQLKAWSQRQTYIALGQLMTVAASMGIDTCPMEGIAPTEYDDILGLEGSGFFTSVTCALGYRSSEDSYADMPKARFLPKDLIRHI